MKIHQLSLFLENKPGQMLGPCRVLQGAGINIRTLTLADTEKFGILRLIVSDWQRARQALEDAGYVVNLTEVVAVEVSDRPGGLTAVLDALEREPVNIEYMYAFTFGREARAVLIFRFDQTDRAIARLTAAGINVLASTDVTRGLEA
jgi:hypothetical protein